MENGFLNNQDIFKKNHFCKDFVFCEQDFANGKIKAESILKIFQQVATEHAEQLGVGYKTMFESNLLWVTSRIKFEILNQPTFGKQYKIATFPSNKTVVDFDRDFVVFDGEKIVLKGQSKWCLINAKTRGIKKMPDNIFDNIPLQTSVFEEKFFKTETLEPKFLPDYSYKVLGDDIDINFHTNNTVYGRIVDLALQNRNEQIKFFQINFLKESHIGDRLDLYCEFSNGVCDFLGKICEKEASFSGKIEFDSKIWVMSLA